MSQKTRAVSDKLLSSEWESGSSSSSSSVSTLGVTPEGENQVYSYLTEQIPAVHTRLDRLNDSITFLRYEIRKMHLEIHQLREAQWVDVEDENVDKKEKEAPKPANDDASTATPSDILNSVVDNDFLAIAVVVCTPALCGLATALVMKGCN